MRIMLIVSEMFFLALGLCSCAIGVRPQLGGGPDLPTVTAELSRLGQYAVWIGGILLALGVVSRFGAFAALAASVATPVLGMLGIGNASAAINGLATTATESGGALLALGCVALWLAGHPYLMAIALVLTALAFAWRNFDSLRAWVLVGKKPRITSSATATSTKTDKP